MRLLACLLLILSLCGFRPYAPAADGPVELEVLDRDADAWLPQRAHRGEAWIAGELCLDGIGQRCGGVLPGRVTGEMANEKFVPQLTPLGKRHSVTATLPTDGWGPIRRLVLGAPAPPEA